MKDPMERMGDAIDKLTNKTYELAEALKVALAENAELKERVKELERGKWL